MKCDVAIIGGGPAGSTTATLLRKYNPALHVAIFEKELFPREHVGESQLPAISLILDEMGVWDKVEAGGFPIKIGSTNRWGKNPELWDFEFFPSQQFVDEPRPAKFQGQRRFTAFQVDRALYDKILLDHAKECGAMVFEGTSVARVHRAGDRIENLELAGGELVEATHFVDASGHVGVIRRAMGVESHYPTSLKNVAFWDYWQNADWAVEIGVGGTKVQVMSLGFGWIWFIPLGPTRTSIGLIVPAEYYKATGKRPEDLYLESIASEERISKLTENAIREGKFTTTKDWSFLSDRQCGSNWFLCGESAGFADPILAAGMTMAHAAGRELAYTILELERGRENPAWLREQYELRQNKRILTHIRFADYWYTANAQFADLRNFTQSLAQEAGLELSPDKAWQWLAQGGFIDEDLSFGVGGFDLNAVKALSNVLTDLPPTSPFDLYNTFRLDLSNANWKERAEYRDGGVRPSQCYTRGDKVLPIAGAYATVVVLLQRTSDLSTLLELIREGVSRETSDEGARGAGMTRAIQALEALITDGWVVASMDPGRPRLKIRFKDQSVRLNSDAV